MSFSRCRVSSSRFTLTAIGSSSVTSARSSTSINCSGSGPSRAGASGNISRVSLSSVSAITASSASFVSSAFLVARRFCPGRIASAMPCNRPPTPAPIPNDSPVPVNTPRSGSYTPR